MTPEAPHVAPNVPLVDTYDLEQCPARERDGGRCKGEAQRWAYGHLCDRHATLLRRGVKVVLVNGTRLDRPWSMPGRFGWWLSRWAS